ncbi:hypothetical protein LCGC14_1606230 [marine sediment metagenome]|uniref:Uncharacterized protein n=1 Tax=marine sediment metagenome TaxID=412755 RepID=A0A0F9KQG3_9ZZZZ
MNWHDVPLRAINFSSFWLTNFAEGNYNLNELLNKTIENKYKVGKEKLLEIVEELVASGLVNYNLKNNHMVFTLMTATTKAVIDSYKKDNLTL